MNYTPSINYKCPHCDADHTYHLVPVGEEAGAVTVSPEETPSINFRCMHCGASATYRLVPD
ncbi:MAG: hypothetical protein JOZ73_05475 [Solirubrobacterales bacterium]|nr:hypothetical protein [Solirubrobacterales bacterium]MBV9799160.1 hypothetical protein [Solirubrobacterales bacterium]